MPARWPLCAAQDGIWYAQTGAPDSPAFNTGQALDLRGTLDVTALQTAVNQTAAEAQSLALRFAGTPDGPVQWLASNGSPRLAHRDLSHAPDPSATAWSAIWNELHDPINLSDGPVAGFTLWRLAPDYHILSQWMHHLVADGYTNVLISNRIAELYNAARDGHVPGPAFAPFDRIRDTEGGYDTSTRRDTDRSYWHSRLSGIETMGEIKPGPARFSDGFHRAEIALAAEDRHALQSLADRADTSWPDVLTALTTAYYARHISEGQAVPGIPLMNRMGKPARAPGTMVNVLPLVVEIDEATPLDDWLRTAASALSDLRRHGRYRGEVLRRELKLVGGTKRLHGPLINVLPFDPTPRFDGLKTELTITGAGSVDDLTFTFRGTGKSGLMLQCDANPARYNSEEVEAHLARLHAFIRNATHAQRLSDIPTLTADERHLHVVTRNITTKHVPDTTLSALIEARLRDTPERTALVFDDDTMTFADVDHRSAALAAQLQTHGVGPEVRVAIALPRSFDLLIALIAVLRAGGTYVPLDPNDRSERSTDMLRRSEPVIVLAAPDYPAGAAQLLPPGEWQDHGQPTACATPDSAAYTLFTSGFTGRPKGVVIEHRAIVNRLLWMRNHYDIGPKDRILQKTPATFDVSVWEFFLPLVSGATLVIAPPDAHRDPARIAALIRRHDITALHFVPSMLALFLASPDAQKLRIRHVFSSGEALPTEMARRFHQTIDGQLHNLYGPTEAAIDVSFFEATGDHHVQSVPIGTPVWNTRLYVLDGQLRPVPDGVAGTLYIAGQQLARGYLGQPELTAERFLPDPFHPSERMYDTGDLAYMRCDDAIVFIGRRDQQVKIRGVRIELGEIETAILRTGLAQNCVLRTDQDSGTTRLIAYAVLQGGVDTHQLRDELQHRLPPSMQPHVIVPLSTLPLTPNGKLDHKALPTPNVLAEPTRPLADGTETLLGRLYAEALDLPRPASPDTDFFAAGGDSLSAVQLTLLIEQEIQHNPGLGAILETPVLSALARQIDGAKQVNDGLGPVLNIAEGREPAFFAIHPAGGLAWCYRGLAQRMKHRVVGLQSPLLDATREAPQSLTALAKEYSDRIETLAPNGPINLLGWSLGGIIAHAAATELQSRQRQIGTVALLDAYPSNCWRDQPEPDEATALGGLLAIAGFNPDQFSHLKGRDAIIGFLRDQSHPLALLPNPVIDGVIRSVQQVNRLVREHREARYDVPVHHIYAARDHAGTPFHPELWRPYAASIDVLELTCGHADLIAAPYSQQVANHIGHTA
ncbi:amino acid adenylation domain-containing protein [Qingshengfaniella alkalisoli]|nr:amino acid adenylation domain-containing protein [Qingshengfaniella alkalisoli]